MLPYGPLSVNAKIDFIGFQRQESKAIHWIKKIELSCISTEERSAETKFIKEFPLPEITGNVMRHGEKFFISTNTWSEADSERFIMPNAKFSGKDKGRANYELSLVIKGEKRSVTK